MWWLRSSQKIVVFQQPSLNYGEKFYLFLLGPVSLSLSLFLSIFIHVFLSPHLLAFFIETHKHTHKSECKQGGEQNKKQHYLSITIREDVEWQERNSFGKADSKC